MEKENVPNGGKKLIGPASHLSITLITSMDDCNSRLSTSHLVDKIASKTSLCKHYIALIQ